ncbi:hypothetical protein C0991_006645 [Blastosporella zonata]|nr:hypothetical protein C0991_006645 [Blastosporella zonata]
MLEKYAIVCNACDEKHQMLPKLGDMVSPSPATAAKLRDAHTMHVMLWIRDDVRFEPAVEDQLSRVEDNLSAVKLLVRPLEARFESMEDALGTLRDFILNSMSRGY